MEALKPSAHCGSFGGSNIQCGETFYAAVPRLGVSNEISIFSQNCDTDGIRKGYYVRFLNKDCLSSWIPISCTWLPRSAVAVLRAFFSLFAHLLLLIDLNGP